MKFHLGSPPAGLIYTVGFSATSRNAVTLSRRWRERSALGRGAANRAGRRSPAIAVTVASINSRKSGLGPQTLPYPIRHKNSPEPLPTPRAAAERNRHDGEFAITSSPGIPGTLIGTGVSDPLNATSCNGSMPGTRRCSMEMARNLQTFGSDE